MKPKKLKAVLAVVIVISLLFLFAMAMYPFIQGFFGALIMFVLFDPLYKFLVRKRINKKISAIIVIIISIFILLIPLLVLLAIITREVIAISENPVIIQEAFQLINSLISRVYPGFSVSSLIGENVDSIAYFLKKFFVKAISGAGLFIVNVLIMYFALYYFLTQKEIFKKAKEIIPFNRKNSDILIKKFKDITHSTLLVTGMIALLQAVLLATGFLIFGIKSWLLWGFISFILSFIPVLGPPVLWVPATIYMFVQGNYVSGIGILAFGLVLSNIDNFIRPYLQQRIGNIHPLITLIGVFTGIPLFGLLGIIIGPLMISYVILTLKMFREEYLK